MGFDCFSKLLNSIWTSRFSIFIKTLPSISRHRSVFKLSNFLDFRSIRKSILLIGQSDVSSIFLETYSHSSSCSICCIECRSHRLRIPAAFQNSLLSFEVLRANIHIFFSLCRYSPMPIRIISKSFHILFFEYWSLFRLGQIVESVLLSFIQIVLICKSNKHSLDLKKSCFSIIINLYSPYSFSLN